MHVHVPVNSQLVCQLGGSYLGCVPLHYLFTLSLKCPSWGINILNYLVVLFSVFKYLYHFIFQTPKNTQVTVPWHQGEKYFFFILENKGGGGGGCCLTPVSLSRSFGVTI